MAERRNQRRKRDMKTYVKCDGLYDLLLAYTPDETDFYENSLLFSSVEVNKQQFSEKTRLNGTLTANCALPFCFKEKQEICLQLFVDDAKGKNDMVGFGSAICTFGSLVGSEAGTTTRRLVNGTLHIRVQEIQRCKSRLVLSVSSSAYLLKYKKSWTNPFLCICKVLEDGSTELSYQTEALFSRATPDGCIRWRPMVVSPYELSGLCESLEIQMFHHSKGLLCRKPVLLATARVKTESLLRNHTERNPFVIPLNAHSDDKNHQKTTPCGKIEVATRYYDHLPGFMGYLNGGIQICFVMGCDKTVEGAVTGTYNTVLNESMDIFKDYDMDMKKTGTPLDPSQFRGLFFPGLLSKVVEYAQKSIQQGTLTYYIFLWLTLGGLQANMIYENMNKVSKYPISVIMVGIGKNEKSFKFMNEFMEQDERSSITFNSCNQATSPRSILQCVHYKSMQDFTKNKSDYATKTRSGLHRQFMNYMLLNEVKPNRGAAGRELVTKDSPVDPPISRAY